MMWLISPITYVIIIVIGLGLGLGLAIYGLYSAVMEKHEHG